MITIYPQKELREKRLEYLNDCLESLYQEIENIKKNISIIEKEKTILNSLDDIESIENQNVALTVRFKNGEIVGFSNPSVVEKERAVLPDRKAKTVKGSSGSIASFKKKGRRR